MSPLVAGIFEDAGCTPEEIAVMDSIAKTLALEVRDLLVERSGLVRPDMVLPFRVLLARVIHADMELAFKRYRTNNAN